MEEKSEIFTYLGYINKTFIFNHTIAHETLYKTEIAMQIYNCLINEKMILDKSQSVLIFDIYPKKTNILVTEYGKHNVEYNKNDLELIYTHLLCLKRNHPILVFKYLYDDDRYDTYEINIDLKHDKIFNIKINTIHYSITFKPIPYLK